MLEADIQDFFDTLEHEWLVKFIKHCVADRRIVRLVQKWLRAGVLEDGKRICSEVGTVQGGTTEVSVHFWLTFTFTTYLISGSSSGEGKGRKGMW